MRRLLVDEVVSSWHNGGSIETSYSNDEVIDVVLRALDGIVRFNATTKGVHTVLVHSWYVGVVASDLAPEGLKDLALLMGMMHDFGEVVVGDFTLPLKSGEIYGYLYETYYEPLEVAFRCFVGEEVLGITDFDEKYQSVKEYVDDADSIVGELELYEDTLEMDEETLKYARSLFNEMDMSVTVEKFSETLEKIVDDLKKTA